MNKKERICIMKIRKSIILLVILMLASSLTACGGADIEKTADTAAATETETELDPLSVPDNLPDR
ncbi:MAG: hypothetical protein IJV76_11915, partial [Clostridia bacterium]|nr:hypothetical protein [Clostridia bacterium]